MIVSALGADREINPEAAGNPAFTEVECDVVKEWVHGGGSLLLIVVLGEAAMLAGARAATGAKIS